MRRQDPDEPDPSQWTLKLKHHKTTVFLYVEPMTSFKDIKKELLRVLNESNSSGKVNGHKIPSDPEHIMLGAPVDHSDLSKGWASLASLPTNDNVTAESVRTTRGGGTSANRNLDCPQGAGLKDGAVLAFKFKSHDANGVNGVNGAGGEHWDVLLPSYEEAYENSQGASQNMR